MFGFSVFVKNVSFENRILMFDQMRVNLFLMNIIFFISSHVKDIQNQIFRLDLW